MTVKSLAEKKAATIRVSFLSFLNKLNKAGFDQQVTTLVVFRMCGAVIAKAEGIEKLVGEMSTIINLEVPNEETR